MSRHLDLRSLGLVLCTLVATTTAKAQAAWPAGAGVEIGMAGAPGKLPPGYEPSGAVWHAGLQRLLIVGDGGQVTMMDRDGGSQVTWDVGGDLEGIALKSPGSTLAYLALEQPNSVLEFDLVAGKLTGRSWDLQTWIHNPANLGIEALTCVNGLFYAGHQATGNVFVFDLLPGGVAQLVNVIPPHLGRGDVSGLHYEPATEILYTIHDAYDVCVERRPNGVFIREYVLAGSEQEGITFAPCCARGNASAFVTQDTGAVLRYEGYPMACTPIGSQGNVCSSCSPAQVTVNTGPSRPFNPPCLVSLTQPVIGTTWQLQVDASGTVGAQWSRVTCRLGAAAALFDQGWLLVSPATPVCFTSRVFSSGLGVHSVPIPDDPGLVGTVWHVQAQLGRGEANLMRFCNSLDVVVGDCP